MLFASGSPGIRLPTGEREQAVVLAPRPTRPTLVSSDLRGASTARYCCPVGAFMTPRQTLACVRGAPGEQEKNLSELSVGEGRAGADSASKVQGTQPFGLSDHIDRSLLQQ